MTDHIPSLGASSSASKRAEIVTLHPSVRVLLSDASRSWHADVTAVLEELVRLEKGWDGYRAIPVKFETAVFSLRVLEAALPTGAPAPFIVPGSGGDLQIEWHTETTDIELHVRAPNDVHALRRVGGRQLEEFNLTNDFIVVAKWIRSMLESADAPRASAA